MFFWNVLKSFEMFFNPIVEKIKTNSDSVVALDTQNRGEENWFTWQKFYAWSRFIWKEAETSPEMTYSYTSNKSNVREFLSYSSFSDTCNRFSSHMFTVDCLKIPSWNSIHFGWPRDHFVLKIQKKLCHPNCARKVSWLSRKGPRLTGTSYRGRFSATLFASEGLPVVFIVFVKTIQRIFPESFVSSSVSTKTQETRKSD